MVPARPSISRFQIGDDGVHTGVRSSARELSSAITRHLMVVHHSDRLHEGVHDRGADKTEAPLSEIGAESVRFRGARGDFMQARSAVLDRLPMYESPDVAVEAPELFPYVEKRPGV